MDILIQNSRGELLTVAIQAADTFDALAERMLVQFGLRMDFENLTDRGNAVGTRDNIVNFLKRNEQRAAVMSDYPTHPQFSQESRVHEGISSESTRNIFGTIVLKARATSPEEIYRSDEEEAVPLRRISDAERRREPMQTDSLDLCRLCAVESEDTTPIHGIGDGNGEIVELIDECFSIVVSRNDLAKNICGPCLESLRRFAEFRRNVMRTNEKFEDLKKNRSDNRRPERNTFVRRFCTVCNRVSSQDEIIHETRCRNDNCKGQIVPVTLNSMYTCEYCLSCYSNVDSLKKHQSRHAGESTPYVCPLCKVSCATYDDTASHWKNEHGKSTFGGFEEDEATVGGGGATTATQTQSQSYRIPRYFVCHYCDRTFAHFEDMNVHRKFCKTANDFQCRSCGLSFENSDKLASHVKGNIDEQRKWQCQDCAASFGSSCALGIHAEKHAQTPRAFACEDCGKHFFKREYLSNHAKVHTGERPFGCPLCNMGFVNSARLSEHKKIIHSDEKHYKCKFCDKAFKRPNARKAHMVIHTGEKSYNCDICSGTFRRNGDLRKHKKIIHGIELPV